MEEGRKTEVFMGALRERKGKIAWERKIRNSSYNPHLGACKCVCIFEMHDLQSKALKAGHHHHNIPRLSNLYFNEHKTDIYIATLEQTWYKQGVF